jgi:outer membrane protein assembly factor BamB
MKKTALLLCILISNLALTQIANWETTVGDNIVHFFDTPKSIVVMHVENPNTPDVVVLDKFTGKEWWTLKNPIDLLPGDDYVEAEYLAEYNLFRFGQLLLVDADTGDIKFNPVKEGIKGVLHSNLFPEGILATVGKNRERYQIFIPFETFTIAWTRNEDEQLDSFTNRKDRTIYNMMKDDPNMSQSLPQIPFTKSPYKGYYHKGKYIVQFFKEIICFDLKTGQELSIFLII